MALGEELRAPAEEWTVVRHHVTSGTLDKVSRRDTQSALIEVVAIVRCI